MSKQASSEQDVTDIVIAYVTEERAWLAEQPDVRRSTIEMKNGLLLRISRKKVEVRARDDKKWTDFSSQFLIGWSHSDHSKQEEHRSVREEDR